MKRWYLVSYDIRDDTRLRHVARILEGYGERLQYSVFRCNLSERDVERLRWELAKVMAHEDDALFIGLCKACTTRLKRRDSRGSWPEEPPGHVVV
ncbi:MAG: CRISPR-associated endonuclease Cas2 [Halobacteria archaeon]